jgi:hypothetical protein
VSLGPSVGQRGYGLARSKARDYRLHGSIREDTGTVHSHGIVRVQELRPAVVVKIRIMNDSRNSKPRLQGLW